MSASSWLAFFVCLLPSRNRQAFYNEGKTQDERALRLVLDEVSFAFCFLSNKARKKRPAPPLLCFYRGSRPTVARMERAREKKDPHARTSSTKHSFFFYASLSYKHHLRCKLCPLPNSANRSTKHAKLGATDAPFTSSSWEDISTSIGGNPSCANTSKSCNAPSKSALCTDPEDKPVSSDILTTSALPPCSSLEPLKAHVGLRLCLILYIARLVPTEFIQQYQWLEYQLLASTTSRRFFHSNARQTLHRQKSAARRARISRIVGHKKRRHA